MRKIIAALLIISLFSCKKIDRLLAPKYCWECRTITYTIVNNHEVMRTEAKTSPCDMTPAEMDEFEKQSSYQLKEGNTTVLLKTICNLKQ